MVKLLVIISLLGANFQSAGKRKETGMEAFLYPMVSTYASEVENCDVDDLNIDSLSDLKNICKSLINSDVCSNVKRKYRMNCNNLESQMELQNVDQVEWPDTSSLDHMKSVWIYNEVEADRLGERDSKWSNFLVNFSKIEKEPEFSCLNEKGKRKVWRNYVPRPDGLTFETDPLLLTVTLGNILLWLGLKLKYPIFSPKADKADKILNTYTILFFLLGVYTSVAQYSRIGDSRKSMNSVRIKKVRKKK